MPPRPFFSFIVSSVSAERPTECVLSARSRKRPGALPCDLPVDPICCVVMNTRPGHGHGARPSLGPPPRRTRLRLRSRLILLVPMLLAFAGCMIGPNYQRPKVSVSPNWGETRGPACQHRIDHLPGLVDAPSTIRSWTASSSGPTGTTSRSNRPVCGCCRPAPSSVSPVGEIFPQTQQAIGSVQYFRPSDRAATGADRRGGGSSQLLAVPDRGPGQLGARLLGTDPARHPIGRSQPAVDPRGLRQHAGDADGGRGEHYIAIRTAEERIRIARENADAQEQILKITEARFRFGTVTQLDVEQARTVLLNTHASIPPLETQRRQAQDALSVLLGMPPNDLAMSWTGPSGIPASPPQVIVGIPADLLRRRPDIRSAELQAVAQSAQIGVAKADLLPGLHPDRQPGLPVDRSGDDSSSATCSGGEPLDPGRSLRAVEHPELRPDHEQRPRAGRGASSSCSSPIRTR